MKTLLGGLALAMVFATSTGCYRCRTTYDPCAGSTYECTEWGFHTNLTGCSSCGRSTCDTVCCEQSAVGCEPCEGPRGCALPCGGYDAGGYDYAPHVEQSVDAESDLATPPPTYAPENTEPSAPPMPTPMLESTGWQPARTHHIRPVRYQVP